MDQIEELKHLLSIAKHPKTHNVIKETIDDAVKDNNESKRSLAT